MISEFREAFISEPDTSETSKMRKLKNFGVGGSDADAKVRTNVREARVIKKVSAQVLLD